MFWSGQPAITNATDGWRGANSRCFFLTFLEAGSPRSGYQCAQVRAADFPLCLYMVEGSLFKKH